MNSHPAEQGALAEVLEALRAEVAGLSQRLAALEASVGAKPKSPSGSPAAAAPVAAPPVAAPPAPAAPAKASEEINQELILVISAAIAAFLGVKPHIRQIRLVSGATWAQQGRATIQASHALSVRHD